MGITPPVNRVCAPGGSIQNHLDAQLIQPLGSQVQFLDSDDVSAPHPIPSCPPPWSPLPSRPCSSATAQSQGELLATRTRGIASQDVGLLPPVDHPPVQPTNQRQSTDNPSYTTPVHRGCTPGRPNSNCTDAQLIQPLVSQVATRKVQQVRFEFLINTRAPDEANNS